MRKGLTCTYSLICIPRILRIILCKTEDRIGEERNWERIEDENCRRKERDGAEILTASHISLTPVGLGESNRGEPEPRLSSHFWCMNSSITCSLIVLTFPLSVKRVHA
jgi:hypothetical protein